MLIKINKYVHTCGGQVLLIDVSPLHWRRARHQWRGMASIGNTCRRTTIFRFWAFKKHSSPKWEIPAKMPLNHPAKFDAASFILAGETRNRTNTQNIQTNKQTVIDISTLCLLAYVDNKKLCYCKGTAWHAMLVNSCYVSRRMRVRKVSNRKSDLQEHWQWCHSICHIQFPISVPLQLCLYLALLMRHKCKKLQFIHTVNGDGSKTAKIIKRQC